MTQGAIGYVYTVIHIIIDTKYRKIPYREVTCHGGGLWFLSTFYSLFCFVQAILI